MGELENSRKLSKLRIGIIRVVGSIWKFNKLGGGINGEIYIFMSLASRFQLKWAQCYLLNAMDFPFFGSHLRQL